MEPLWLRWARELQAIAQTGLAFTTDPYDQERYGRIRALAAEIMAERSGEEPARIAALFAEQSGYATPKVDVRAAIFEEGRVLLVREVADGKWSLPGGWADVNQAPSEAVIREVREEAGLDVTVRKLAAVHDRARHPHQPPKPFHVYKLFFICDIVGGRLQTGPETSGADFFDENDLPELSTGRVLDYQISRMFEHARTPTLPTDFD